MVKKELAHLSCSDPELSKHEKANGKEKLAHLSCSYPELAAVPNTEDVHGLLEKITQNVLEFGTLVVVIL